MQAAEVESDARGIIVKHISGGDAAPSQRHIKRSNNAASHEAAHKEKHTTQRTQLQSDPGLLQEPLEIYELMNNSILIHECVVCIQYPQGIPNSNVDPL